MWIFSAVIENVDRENPFPSEYDVDAASEYMSAFNDRIEQMKKREKKLLRTKRAETLRGG